MSGGSGGGGNGGRTGGGGGQPDEVFRQAVQAKQAEIDAAYAKAQYENKRGVLSDHELDKLDAKYYQLRKEMIPLKTALTTYERGKK